MRIAVTGHRPQRLSDPPCWDPDHPLRVAIRQKLGSRLIAMAGDRPRNHTCITGMAQGVDQDFARVALDLGCTVEAYLPCMKMYAKWTSDAVVRWDRLLAEIKQSGGRVMFVSDQPYVPGCMQRRDEAVVDASDHLIAVWDGAEHGGTWHTISYAQEKWGHVPCGVACPQITVIDPESLLARS